MEKRDNFIDVFKGFALLAIVQSHTFRELPVSGFPLAEFGLTYGVMAFVFVSGWLFRGISDTDGLYRHIGKRVTKLWWLFFAYCAGMLVFCKLLVRLGIFGELYNVGLFKGLYNALVMINELPLLYPIWFVQMFLLASLFFAGSFWFCEKRRHKMPWHCAAAFCFACVGMYSYIIDYYPPYYVNAALLAVPIMYAGYVAAGHRERFMRCIKWWGCLVASVFLLYLCLQEGEIVHLSNNILTKPLLFYPISAAGIYMALGITKLLVRLPYLSDALALCGRNSFHVMALHLLMFKIIDLVWGALNGLPPSACQDHPISFGFWPVYVLLGTALSVAAAELGKWLIGLGKKKLALINSK